MPKPVASFALFRESSETFATLTTVSEVPVSPKLSCAVPVFTDPQVAADVCILHNARCIPVDRCVVASFPVPTKSEDVQPFNVNGCARCGGDHEGLPFHSFNNPPTDLGGNMPPRWAMCPVLGQPIIMAISTTDDVQSPVNDRDKLAKFKAYVHDRLDKAGVPVDPPSPHQSEGCRIGGRLDYVLNLAGLGVSKVTLTGDRPATQSGSCQKELMAQGKSYPRTCADCGITGPCRNGYDARWTPANPVGKGPLVPAKPWEPKVNDDVLYGDNRLPARIIRVEGNQYILRCPSRSTSPVGATREEIFPFTGEGLKKA